MVNCLKSSLWSWCEFLRNIYKISHIICIYLRSISIFEVPKFLFDLLEWPLKPLLVSKWKFFFYLKSSFLWTTKHMSSNWSISRIALSSEISFADTLFTYNIVSFSRRPAKLALLLGRILKIKLNQNAQVKS